MARLLGMQSIQRLNVLWQERPSVMFPICPALRNVIVLSKNSPIVYSVFTHQGSKLLHNIVLCMVCPLFLTIRHQTTYPMLDTASSTSMGPWATSDPFLSPSVEPIEVWLGPISPLPMLAFLADIPWCFLEAVYQEYQLGKASQIKNTS